MVAPIPCPRRGRAEAQRGKECSRGDPEAGLCLWALPPPCGIPTSYVREQVCLAQAGGSSLILSVGGGPSMECAGVGGGREWLKTCSSRRPTV